MSTLLTQAQLDQLLANGGRQAAVKGTAGELDLWPMVKRYTPDGSATWLLTELDADGDTAFGLCDLGMGSPELGCVSLAEIRFVRGKRYRWRDILELRKQQLKERRPDAPLPSFPSTMTYGRRSSAARPIATAMLSLFERLRPP